MRVLIIGATGFLGSAVHAALVDRGHSVVATYHRGAEPAAIPATRWWRCDLTGLTAEEWRKPLIDVDAVVNCAGILQDSIWESTSHVHIVGLRTLIEASERAHLSRFIHFSALGVIAMRSALFPVASGTGRALLRGRF